ncbi:MAG: DUF4261 domain-containing protein [Saprospiraceae bacterium]|nr:DUF4261 domain-containing protein [Saprospiraceae bacterium]
MRLTILFATIFSLFSFHLQAQRASVPNATEGKVVTGTVLINDRNPVDFKALLAGLRSDWGVRIDSSSQSEKTLVVHTATATVMFANMDYPASPAEISGAVEGAWLWRSAAEEAPRHQSQLVVSVIGQASRPLDAYKLYTRVTAAALDNTRSCGVYLASQYLLQSKTFFLQAARNLNEKVLPIYCWIYFGMLQDGGASSAYTFGLSELGMPDLEIVKSAHSLQEAHAILYDAVNHALQNGIRLQDGSQIETQEGQKINLKLSKGVYLNDKVTLKVAY